MGSSHSGPIEPSPWVVRYAALISPQGRVLDLACGRGRHVRHLIERDYKVIAVDIDVSDVADLVGDPRVDIVGADLEGGAPWPLGEQNFTGIIVTNYLYRPLFPSLVRSLAPGGILIYETFMRGNEAFGRPRNPDHLLLEGELLEAFGGALRIIAFEQGTIDRPKRAAVQRLVAGRPKTGDGLWPIPGR